MAASHGPRWGRPERLAALREGRYREDILGLDRPAAAATKRLLVMPAPVDPVQASAEQLAELLKPLPSALDEIAARINRHCGATTRDAELRAVVEAVRQRTWDLWRAIDRLAEAAGGRSI